jgi:murein endopeptidase
MPVSGPGFENFEAMDTTDQHDFGTQWLGDTIRGAGTRYASGHLRLAPGAARIVINDVSLPEGGDTPDHAGHETGLACDLRLPRRDGGSGGIGNPNNNSHYDRDAMRAQIQSLRAEELVRRVFFNDRVLVEEGVCDPWRATTTMSISRSARRSRLRAK